MGIPGYSALLSVYVSKGNWYTPFAFCGGLGERCCEAPFQNAIGLGPLVSCDQGMGCDLTTKTCVAPCGGPGQPCCDGPQTRAPKWTADGRVYSPDTWNMQEMCTTGACETQTHRCFSCGMQDLGPCCPPDAAQATARCRGTDLECQFNPWGFFDSGTCIQCGIRGRKPCNWGCQAGLGIRSGLCDVCGDNFQPPCDIGCKPGLGELNSLCRQCGKAGQVPCDAGCSGGLKLKGGLCAACGKINQPVCDAGCDYGAVPVGGFCRECGHDREPPCAIGSPCAYPLKLAGGVCRFCGSTGQIPCDAGCNSGLAVKNGLCAMPDSPTPVNCASVGEACVPDTLPGMHCCQNPGAGELCVYGHCKACFQHGEIVPEWGSQVCCTPGEVVIWDQTLEKGVCGIVSPPDK